MLCVWMVFRAARSVNSICILCIMPICNMGRFPFLFRERDCGSDCTSSWSLLTFTFEDDLIEMNKLARSSTYVYGIFLRHSRAANSCLHDVLYVGRPVNSRSETTLYSFTCNGKLVLSIGTSISCPLYYVQ